MIPGAQMWINATFGEFRGAQPVAFNKNLCGYAHVI